MRIVLFTGLSATILLASCGGDTSNEATPVADSTAATAPIADSGAVDELTRFKYDKVISNIPIPFDILREHATVPLMFKGEVLSNPASLSKYSTTTSKALNLGVYGADLAYSITYEKFTDMGNYLKCVKKLSDDLGIPLAFDQKMLATYKKYETNKDSLEKLVFDSYAEVDKTLRSNERIGLASLVVAGGWLEGLNSTLKTAGALAKDDKSAALYKKVWEQKNHLNEILGLLGQFKDDAAIMAVIKDLESLKSIYDGLAVPGELSAAEFSALAQKADAIRTGIVAGK